MTEPLNVSFSVNSADSHVTEYDITMAYECFWGRFPENSDVINDHKRFDFVGLVKQFVSSDELTKNIYNNLTRGIKLERFIDTRSPSRKQISWITGKMILEENRKQKLYSVSSWEEFYYELLSLTGSAKSLSEIILFPDKAFAPSVEWRRA